MDPDSRSQALDNPPADMALLDTVLLDIRPPDIRNHKDSDSFHTGRSRTHLAHNSLAAPFQESVASSADPTAAESVPLSLRNSAHLPVSHKD